MSSYYFAQAGLKLLGSSDPSFCSSLSSRWDYRACTIAPHSGLLIKLIFLFLVEMEFHHVGQTGLELLTSGEPPTSASRSARITGVSHLT